MPSLEGYRSHLDYSYAPGIFPLRHIPVMLRSVSPQRAAACFTRIISAIAISPLSGFILPNSELFNDLTAF